MPEDTDQPAEQQQQQINLHLGPDGLTITVPVALTIPHGALAQIAMQVIAQNEALADEIVKQRVAFLKQKQAELAVVKRRLKVVH